jgi:hypothetical protein
MAGDLVQRGVWAPGKVHGLTGQWGHCATMPSDFAVVKQEPPAADSEQGHSKARPSLEQEARPEPRVHEYTLPNATKVHGFTEHRARMPSYFERGREAGARRGARPHESCWCR